MNPGWGIFSYRTWGNWIAVDTPQESGSRSGPSDEARRAIHAGGGDSPVNSRQATAAGPKPATTQEIGTPPPAPAFDASELIDDFEHPVCTFCVGVGHVRDENGIHMVPCSYCEGTGRAPQRDDLG